MGQSTKAISPLRQRMIEDMTLRKLTPNTQIGYVRAVTNFTRFLGRSPDTAEAEDLRRYQLVEQGWDLEHHAEREHHGPQVLFRGDPGSPRGDEENAPRLRTPEVAGNFEF